MSLLRRPLSWAIAITLVGLATSPAAHYGWEGVAFGVGGITVVMMEALHRPRWRSILVWGWMLDATLLTLAGLMFRVSAPTAPSGPTAFVLCTVVGFGGAWALRDSSESPRAHDR